MSVPARAKTPRQEKGGPAWLQQWIEANLSAIFVEELNSIACYHIMRRTMSSNQEIQCENSEHHPCHEHAHLGKEITICRTCKRQNRIDAITIPDQEELEHG
eukprot:1855500-Amphidinium_carterae.1